MAFKKYRGKSRQQPMAEDWPADFLRRNALALPRMNKSPNMPDRSCTLDRRGACGALGPGFLLPALFILFQQ